MAYSCVEVWFEIGHDASIRTKRTPEGYTHDWEVFVRGVDNSDIHYFVEKVVFHLHETFHKPKRVLKEPPYSLKESGYGSFNLPIEVYFKNKDEPKKVKYHYDLHLEPSGPPISRIKREKYTFANPSEDFRRKLIRGGGVGVLGSEAGGNSVSSEKTCAEEGTPSVQPTVKHSTPTLAGKPKLTSDPTKKAKIKDAKLEEPKPSNSFADLFGPPIKTAKVSPDPKKPSQSKVSPVSKNSKPIDKTDKSNSEKQYTPVKPKHIPQKEIKKDSSSREEKGERKDKSRERERSKEKSSSTKHSTSPPKLTKEEPKKSTSSEHKEKVESKTSSDVKSDRKKDKKVKDEKVKKDKHKDIEKVPSERSEKSEKHVKENKEKDQKKSPKVVNKEVEKVREKEKHRDSEKDRLKHKHKKREKEKYKKGKEESKEREKVKKTELKAEEKENSSTSGEHRGEKRKRSESRSLSPSPRPSPILPTTPEKEVERPAPPMVKEKTSKHPLSTLFKELEDHETSDSNSSHLSVDEDIIEISKAKSKIFSPREIKPDLIKEPVRVEEKPEILHQDNVIEPLNQIVEEVKVAKHKQSSHRDKSSSLSNSSKSKSKEKSTKKKDRDSGETIVPENKEIEKKKKKRSKRAREEESIEEPAAKEVKEDEEEVRGKEETEEVTDNVLRQPVDNSSNCKPKFSKEYLTELLDLQKKIMTIKDDTELQKVVQVLAQSGKYEITKKSFDVDLCALDKNTVKKLQEFFSVS